MIQISVSTVKEALQVDGITRIYFYSSVDISIMPGVLSSSITFATCASMIKNKFVSYSLDNLSFCYLEMILN